MMRSAVVRAASLLVFFALWQIIAMLAHTAVLPTPVEVVAQLWIYAVSDELPFQLGVTLLRVAVSFALAMLIGTAIGIVMGRSKRADLALDGILVLGLNIPALVTIILCYIWFGLTETAAITAVVLNKIPLIMVILREGARAIDLRLLAVGQAYRLPLARRLFKLYLPQLYPYLMSAARNGLALIWRIVLVVELLGRSNGVGFKISVFFQFFDITSVLADALAFAAVIMLIEALLLRPIENRLNR